jgi:cell wall-associated NlpC family hydrolase
MSQRLIKALLFIFCFSFIYISLAQPLPKTNLQPYAIAQIPTPVLNIADFSLVFGGNDEKTLCLDNSGLIREVEFIALPETVFKINQVIKKANTTIYEVTTTDYPYSSKKGYFIDSRFVKMLDHKAQDRIKKLPAKETVIKNLISCEGGIYIWGGNCKAGIPQLLSFYPPQHAISSSLKDQWILKGLDCSGLLYEATNGFTPRNTSSLVNFGEPVRIINLNSDQIIQKVKPLDLIVWNGHVIIILDENRVIESRLDYEGKKAGNQGGVKIRNLKTVLSQILEKRIPVDNYDDASSKNQFVIRRWYK